MEGPSFGIRLGNSTFSIAGHFDGRNTILSNSRGDRTTPAIVSVSDGEHNVGVTAKQRIGRPNVSILCGMKALLQFGDFDATVGSWPHSRVFARAQVDPTKGTAFFNVGGGGGDDACKRISLDEALEEVFGELMQIARSQVPENKNVKVVLTVPVHFGERKIQALKKAAAAADFDVIQTIVEPAAALLAYEIAQVDAADSPTCLVYRIGGKTSDVSIVTTASGMYSIEGHKYYQNLGGDAFTVALADHFRAEFKQKYKMDPCEDSRRAYHKLYAAAEECKHVLSTLNSASAFVESLRDGVDFSSNVTRARFDSLISPVADAYLQPIRDILSETGRGFDDVDKIILIGGSMKIPRLRKLIQEMFPAKAQLLASIAPDEVVAVGAAQQSGIVVSSPLISVLEKSMNGDVAHELDDFSELPCLSRGVFYKVGREGRAHCLLKSKVLIPAHNVVHLGRDAARDGCVRLAFFESDDDKGGCASVGANFLGDLELEGLADDANVSVSCSVTKDGSVTIALRDSESNKMKELCLEVEDNE